MKTLKIKIVSMFILAILSIATLAMPVLAAETPAPSETWTPLPSAGPTAQSTAAPGSVAAVVNDAYKEVKSQAEVVFRDVIVNAIRVILIIAMFIVCGFAWRNHHQGQGVNWIPVVVIGVCLALSLVLPELLWGLA